MQKYYYTDGTDRFGPFTLEELRNHNVTKNTLVWYEGMADWQPAGQVAEMDALFSATPPASKPMVTPPVASSPSSSSSSSSSAGGGSGSSSASRPSSASAGPQRPSGPPPKTWLVESILVTLFCCLPFGVVGIVYATSVENKWYSGNTEEALKASADAGKWTKLGFWIGIAGFALYIIAIIIMAAVGALNEF